MKLSMGFSPCPNDTFIFDAMVNKRIPTQGFEFDVVLEDVQTLNRWAAEGKLDITKLSFPALFDHEEKYTRLKSGGALGNGVGPLLIGRTQVVINASAGYKVAIPGENTTANFLLSFAYPQLDNKIPMLFSDIEDAVLSGVVDLGVIIHENRFTYQQKGLVKIEDLGAVWEMSQALPIPLGCIAIRSSLDTAIQQQVDVLIRESLLYAMRRYPDLPPYVAEHAQEMDEEIMRNHIELYVNEFSIDTGAEGERAIKQLQGIYNLIKKLPE